MEDDDVTNPEAEGEEPEEQEVTEAEGEPEEDAEEEGDEQEAEPELEEAEYEGKTYRLPKELKEALLRQADYTRKTQEVAETRKALDARKAEIDQHAETQRQFIKEYAQIEAINDRLAQYEKIDWSALNAQDPVRAQGLFIEYSQLKDRRTAVENALREKATGLEQQRAAERAKQVEEANAVLRRDIPNWGPELVSKLWEFGEKQVGLKPEELSRVVDPRHVKLLNLAYIGHQLAEKQRNALAKPKPAEAKPVPTVKSKGKPDGRLRDDISMEEWARRWRAKQAKG